MSTTISSPGRVEGDLAPVPEAVAPPPGNPRFPHVDGLRAIAALSILLYHAELVSSLQHGGVYVVQPGFGYQLLYHLNVGVPIFFVISGFLLYRPCIAARLGVGPPVSTRSFYRRRVLRIVPGYWLALTVLAIYPGLGLSVSGSWPYYLLVHNLSRATFNGGLAVSWSLCVEASFYLLLPLYALAIVRWTRRMSRGQSVRRELLALFGLFASATGLQIYIASGGHTDALLYLTRTLPLCIDWFALGMALALVSVVGPGRIADQLPILRRLRLGNGTAWWALAGSVWLACIAFETKYPYAPLEHFVYGIVAVCILAPAVFLADRRSWVTGALRRRQLVWLGLISYGLFLWQLRLLELLHSWGMNAGRTVPGLVLLAAAGLGATVIAATLSYYLVERPFLRLKSSAAARRVTRRREVLPPA